MPRYLRSKIFKVGLEEQHIKTETISFTDIYLQYITKH